jgi:hypothetical protein
MLRVDKVIYFIIDPTICKPRATLLEKNGSEANLENLSFSVTSSFLTFVGYLFIFISVIVTIDNRIIFAERFYN